MEKQKAPVAGRLFKVPEIDPETNFYFLISVYRRGVKYFGCVFLEVIDFMRNIFLKFLNRDVFLMSSFLVLKPG